MRKPSDVLSLKDKPIDIVIAGVIYFCTNISREISYPQEENSTDEGSEAETLN